MNSTPQPTPLSKNKSFWGITTTQFLGAFNDSIFKQVVLLLLVAVPLANGETKDYQSIALLVFSLPFVLFSGFAGYLSDKYSKKMVIVACKVAELIIMAVGIFALSTVTAEGVGTSSIIFLCVVLMFMGMQSAFFGPGKFGILPELFTGKQLPTANGIVTMTTFISIILGSALAGVLTQHQSDKLWLVGCLCVVIAGIGIFTSTFIRKLKPAAPELKFKPDSLTIPIPIRNLFKSDQPLFWVAIVSSSFWTTASIINLAINSYGKVQLGQSDIKTSLLLASLSIGIALGSVVAGTLSKNLSQGKILKVGVSGIALILLIMSCSLDRNGHWLGYYGSVGMFICLGVFTGMFAIPLQVTLQSRPPLKLKGRMMATANFMNWLGILGSSFVYMGFSKLVSIFELPASSILGMTTILILPVVFLYKPPQDTLNTNA